MEDLIIVRERLFYAHFSGILSKKTLIWLLLQRNSSSYGQFISIR